MEKGRDIAACLRSAQVRAPHRRLNRLRLSVRKSRCDSSSRSLHSPRTRSPSTLPVLTRFPAAKRPAWRSAQAGDVCAKQSFLRHHARLLGLDSARWPAFIRENRKGCCPSKFATTQRKIRALNSSSVGFVEHASRASCRRPCAGSARSSAAANRTPSRARRTRRRRPDRAIHDRRLQPFEQRRVALAEQPQRLAQFPAAHVEIIGDRLFDDVAPARVMPPQYWLVSRACLW